jgi:hypothetical protein
MEQIGLLAVERFKSLSQAIISELQLTEFMEHKLIRPFDVMASKNLLSRFCYKSESGSMK